VNSPTYALSYDDVLLVPQKSDIRSRTEISLAADLGKGLQLEVPIFSAPMDTVTTDIMAASLGNLGASGVIHRYNTATQQAALVQSAREKSLLQGTPLGAAIGVTEEHLDRACTLVEAGVSFLCVDVAHGHHILVKEMLQKLRKNVGEDIHIMAGNVATLEGVNALADWGADSVRCNIGGGSICSTRIQTGHGVPGLQTIFDCAKTDRDVAIIADGGIRNSGDIVKALAAGADAVMCGSMFAGTSETPGDVHRDREGASWKVYRGMASREAQTDWKGTYSSLEGIATTVPFGGNVTDVIKDLSRGLRSGLSYSGARTIEELQALAVFINQTGAGLTEGNTHILSRH